MIRRERSSRRTYYYFPDHSIYAVSLCVTVFTQSVKGKKKITSSGARVNHFWPWHHNHYISSSRRQRRVETLQTGWRAHRLSAVQQLPGVIRGYGRHLNRLPKCLRKLLGLFSFLAKRDVRTLPDRCFFLESKKVARPVWKHASVCSWTVRTSDRGVEGWWMG